MTDIFSKAFRLIVGKDVVTGSNSGRPLKHFTERELITLESQIGSKLFGPVPAGGRREFFSEDSKNWIWYEQWIGPDKKPQSLTTRYEVHKDGIIKVRIGKPYEFIEGQELQNLVMAVQMYHEQVMRDIYKRDPKTGKLLS